MRASLFCCSLLVSAAIWAQPTEPLPTEPLPAAPAPAVVESVPPAKAPLERPKPAEKPKPVAAAPKPPEPVKPPPAPAAAPKPPEPAKPEGFAPAAGTANPAGSAAPLGCWGLAFAMLLVGFVAGFLWRHQTSRRKLGGMSVRIGTWRGIP